MSLYKSMIINLFRWMFHLYTSWYELNNLLFTCKIKIKQRRQRTMLSKQVKKQAELLYWVSWKEENRNRFKINCKDCKHTCEKPLVASINETLYKFMLQSVSSGLMRFAAFQLFLQLATNGSRYSRMDQAKFVEDPFKKLKVIRSTQVIPWPKHR